MKEDKISKMNNDEKARYFISKKPQARLLTQWDEEKKDFVFRWYAKLGLRLVSLHGEKEFFDNEDEAIELAIKYKKMCKEYLTQTQIMY